MSSTAWGQQVHKFPSSHKEKHLLFFWYTVKTYKTTVHICVYKNKQLILSCPGLPGIITQDNNEHICISCITAKFPHLQGSQGKDNIMNWMLMFLFKESLWKRHKSHNSVTHMTRNGSSPGIGIVVPCVKLPPVMPASWHSKSKPWFKPQFLSFQSSSLLMHMWRQRMMAKYSGLLKCTWETWIEGRIPSFHLSQLWLL